METLALLSKMHLVIFPLLLSVALAADVTMNIDGTGGYNFNYNTEDEGAHSRSESGSNGVISGSYSYKDPNGNVRAVSYTAGPDGFNPSGDIGVDKKTAEEAARIAALAPKAPEAPAPVAPVPAWQWNGAPFYGGWHGAGWHGAWGAPWYGAWPYHHWGPAASWGYAW